MNKESRIAVTLNWPGIKKAAKLAIPKKEFNA